MGRGRDGGSLAWLDHRHYRTYEIALGITRAVGQGADLRDLEPLTAGIAAFLAPWQKHTAVHRLAWHVADGMFLRDTAGPYIRAYELTDGGGFRSRRCLPVDIALDAYGILDDGEWFTVPEPDGTLVRTGNVSVWHESDKVADACYEYTLELRLTGEYEQLMAQLSAEVFHTVFPNRLLLGRLHRVLAGYVSELGPGALEDEPSLAGLFSEEGRLQRVPPPKWARRAVFYRDQGHCASCGVNLTGLLDPLPVGHFDHIVPLSRGGLNDISNLQLLCQACNLSKSAEPEPPGTRHRRYYQNAPRR